MLNEKMKLVDRAKLFVFCSLLIGWVGETTQQGINPSLQPPPGNSLVLKSITQNGKQIYKCSAEAWVVIEASADLVMASNPSIQVGTYSSHEFTRQGRSVATWNLDNRAGDEAESGRKFSTVSGKEIVSIASGAGHISKALFQATAHQFDGSAALISYIQRVFPRGGNPPLEAICLLDATIVEVPFEVEFWFWQQDLSPPTVPPSLGVTSERVLQGFFGEGVVMYIYNGAKWQQTQAEATLYNVPGGAMQGKFFMHTIRASHQGRRNSAAAASKFWWQINDPNGFQAAGKPQSAPHVAIKPHSLPWSLVTISSYSKNNSGQWNFTHVQIVSTRAGLPPTHTLFKPIKGMIIRSPFSAIFWFYIKF